MGGRVPAGFNTAMTSMHVPKCRPTQAFKSPILSSVVGNYKQKDDSLKTTFHIEYKDLIRHGINNVPVIQKLRSPIVIN